MVTNMTLQVISLLEGQLRNINPPGREQTKAEAAGGQESNQTAAKHTSTLFSSF